MTAAADLAAHLRRISALERVAGWLNWDQETQMPPRGGAQRGEEAAAVAAALHALMADPRLAELCDAVEAADAGPRMAVDVAEARRIHHRATRIDGDLAAALARTTAEAQTAWAAAKDAARFADFAPALDRVLALKRAEARALAGDVGEPYDALLDDHEPGLTAEAATALFAALRPGLVDLRGRLEGAPAAPRASGRFPAAAQLALSRRIGAALGYDWDAGRLDQAAHPFCNGRLGDVRITTRIDEAEPFYNIYATIHEIGHALYEQGLDPEAALTPAGAASSMGVHESQSRLFENQIGRSRAFTEWLHAEMRAAFGDFGLATPDDLYRAANAVETGFIRTEADEVHYNLHVMLRFDLERGLIAGDLAVADLEAAWNDRFAADFGVTPPDAARGVLQDVHWSVGAFGYFPTYTLGNVYAAELDVALRADLPGLDADLARGDVGGALEWLRARIHRRGRMAAPARLIAEATGRAPDPATLVAALDAKYGALYGLA